MADRMVWAHDYAMRPGSPAFAAAPAQGGGAAPAVFVFDEEWIASERVSLKRLVFLYECALELPVSIRKGPVVETVLAFAREHGARTVVTTASVSPRIRGQVARLRRSIRVEAIEDEAFVDFGGREPDLKRFSRYWSKAERRVFEGAEPGRGESLLAGTRGDDRR